MVLMFSISVIHPHYIVIYPMEFIPAMNRSRIEEKWKLLHVYHIGY